MKMMPTFVLRLAALCVAATTSAAYAQNAIQLFPPANVRYSTAGTSYQNPNTFNTTILNLSCTATPITATISSNPMGTGNVLVDNFITFSSGQVSANICAGGTNEDGGVQDCFNTTYQNAASDGNLNGQDPDNYAANGGVPPIDVSGLLTTGSVQATISMVDTGGVLAGSSLYLYTNCTSQGVTGPGQVTGNPIPQSNPTDAQLVQTFPFNPTVDQQVEFTYGLSEAQDAGTLSITDGTVPTTTDLPLDPSSFSTSYLNGTSFATANCLLHTGETFNGSAACKLYTLTCQQGTSAQQSGALCPTSSQRNEIFQEAFDGPSFSLSDHQGVGLLEAKDGWTGLSCVFDPSSGLGNLLCPQNILTNFSGPGRYTSGGRSTNPNSTFISVAPVPEPVTSYVVAGLQPGNWVNTPTTTVNFTVTPPTATVNNFVAAPIQSLTYGTSSPSSVPPPDPPVTTDTVLINPASCPTPGSQNPPLAGVYTPPAQSLTLSDGQYTVHYLAADCAGTEELKFTNSGGSWSTSFYTFPLNVDTVAPQVSAGPTLSPAPSTIGGVANAYMAGTVVKASYSCTDDRSGVVKCGTQTYAPGTTLNTGTLISPVSTSTPGTQTFTVNAVDAAGNTAANAVTYTVVSPAANLSILKGAPRDARSGGQITYGIVVADFGRQAASSPVITDPLPSGVTFIKATAVQLVCTNRQCTNQASCSFTGNTVTCTSPSVTLLTPIAVEITVKVTAAPGSKITNTATVSSPNPEGRGRPQASATTTVK